MNIKVWRINLFCDIVKCEIIRVRCACMRIIRVYNKILSRSHMHVCVFGLELKKLRTHTCRNVNKFAK